MDNELIKIVSLFGGWTVVVSAISVWLGKMIAEKASIHWKTDQQKQIAELRNELNKSSQLLESMLSNLSSGQQQIQPKRIDAIESLWNSVLLIREKYAPANFFYDVWSPDEYRSETETIAMQRTIALLSEENHQAVLSGTGKLEEKRPYLGEVLWSYFYIYRAFLGRTAEFIIRGKIKGKMDDWRVDEGVLELLSLIISKDEISEITRQNKGGFSKFVTLLESKMLNEINALISGRISSLDSLTNAREIMSKLNEIEVSSSFKVSQEKAK